MKQFAKRRPPGPARELYDLLEGLAWQNKRLAAEVSVSENTVSRWINRKTTPPASVLVLLRQRLKAKRAVEARTAGRRAQRSAAIFIICPGCGQEVSHQLTCSECGVELPLRKGLIAA